MARRKSVSTRRILCPLLNCPRNSKRSAQRNGQAGERVRSCSSVSFIFFSLECYLVCANFRSLKNINKGKVKAKAIANVPKIYNQRNFILSFLISRIIHTMAGIVSIKKSNVILAAKGVAVPCLKYSAKVKGIGEYMICWILKYQGINKPIKANIK